MEGKRASAASYDLHLHSHWSCDGEIAPETYFRGAQVAALKCFAITDHNNVDAGPELAALRRTYPNVRAVLGAELDVDGPLGVFHILCYGFGDPIPPAVQSIMATYRQRYQQQAEVMLKGMQASGYDFTEEDILQLLSSFRPEVAVAEQGLTPPPPWILEPYFRTKGYLKEGESIRSFLANLPRASDVIPCPDADAIIPTLKSAGILVAAAHPTVYFRITGRVEIDFDRKHMDALKEIYSLDGVECAHMPTEQQQVCREYCRENDLFSVSGTDLHRFSDVSSALGSHGGSDDWLDEFLERLG